MLSTSVGTVASAAARARALTAAADPMAGGTQAATEPMSGFSYTAEQVGSLRSGATRPDAIRVDSIDAPRSVLGTLLDDVERAAAIVQPNALPQMPRPFANSGAFDMGVEHVVDAIRALGGNAHTLSEQLGSAARALHTGRQELIAAGLDQTTEGAALVTALSDDADALALHSRQVQRPTMDALETAHLETAHQHARAGSNLLIAAGSRPTHRPEVDDVLAGGRMLRTRSPEQLDSLERLLGSGTEVDGTRGTISSSLKKNINGPLTTFDVEDGAQVMPVVRKQPHQQSAQEYVGWKAARLAGIDYLYPGVGLRPSGSVYIEKVAGAEFGVPDIDITSSTRLERALSSWYDRHASDLAPDSRIKWRRIEYQLSQFVDFLLANGDRHKGNGLFNESGGDVHFIDFGNIGRARAERSSSSPTTPQLRSWAMQGNTNHVMFDAETLRIIRARFTPDAIRDLHATTIAKARIDDLQGWDKVRLEFLQSESAVDEMIERLEHVLENGGFRYTPMK